MLEGQLFYDEETDNWVLKNDGKEIVINNLIYGISDLNSYFPDFEGEGEKIKITFEVLSN